MPLEARVLLSASAAGADLEVNTYTSGHQRTYLESPRSVAMDADGDFVVTWTSTVQDGSGEGVSDASGGSHRLQRRVCAQLPALLLFNVRE